MCDDGGMARRSIEPLHPAWRANVDLLTATSHREGLSTGQTAYVLATAFHEARLGQWMLGGADRGTDDPLDGLRFRGRGFARLTGRPAYAEFAEQLDLPLLDHPELAATPAVAADILVHGMSRGCFTGHRLADFIDRDRTDYVGARRVMDPADHPIRVARCARAFEAHLDGVEPDEPTTSDVRLAQRQLTTIGWPLDDDGILGRYTTQAISDFQAGYCRMALEADGQLDPRTCAAIATCANEDGFTSDHFRFAEFRTPEPATVCGANHVIRVGRELVEGLEAYRRVVGRPVGIACGYRSPRHNAAVGARPDSEHLTGRAVHVRDPQLPADVVAAVGAFTSIGHRFGVAVHLGLSPERSTAAPRIYPLDEEARPTRRPLVVAAAR